jgi:hypothetical protein
VAATVVVFVFVGLLIGMPLLLARYESRHGRAARRRAIEGRENTAIAALREGELATIRGVVTAREPLLTAPISGQACIGYRASIGEPHGDRVYAVLNRETWSSFLVTDETGSVVVLGPLQMDLGPSDRGMALSLKAWDLLKEDNIRMNDLRGPRTFVGRETLLKVGGRVIVVGRPSRPGSATARGSVGEPAGLCVMCGTSGEPVVVIDDVGPVGVPAKAQSPAHRQIEAPRVRGPSRREIERRERTAIAALREGEPAKVQGVVAAREALMTSPISGRTCVGYRITIHQGREASTAEHGVLVVRREAWPSFLVSDDTGSAVADGPFSILLAPYDSAWANLPTSVYALLEEAGVPLDKEFQFQETLLEPGDHVSVVGRPSLEIDPAGRSSLREPPRLYVLRGSDEEPVAVIDDEEPMA